MREFVGHGIGYCLLPDVGEAKYPAFVAVGGPTTYARWLARLLKSHPGDRMDGGRLVSLAIEINQLGRDVVEISPHGEIDVDTAHEVREAVWGVLHESRPFRIELNLKSVTFIDSVGISALVAGFQTAEVSGARLAVTKPSRFVHRQLWVTGLLGLFGAPEPYEPDDSGQVARAGWGHPGRRPGE